MSRPGSAGRRAALSAPALLCLLAACGGGRQSPDRTARAGGADSVGAAATADTTPLILFVVVEREDGARIDPVGTFGPDGAGPGTEPPTNAADSIVAGFQARWYGGRGYRLLAGGRDGGVVTALEPVEAACVDISARARLEGGATLWDSIGLAVNKPGRDATGWRRRPPSGAERTLLDSLALSRVPDSVPGTVRARLRPTRSAAYTTPEGALLVATYDAHLAQEPRDRDLSVLVVAESLGGRWSLAYAQVSDGLESESASWQFVDAVDLDRDRIPELVVRDLYYEGVGYSILVRTAWRGWQLGYRGGGGGC